MEIELYKDKISEQNMAKKLKLKTRKIQQVE